MTQAPRPNSADASDRSTAEALDLLTFRIRLLLPEEYQDTYDQMRPTPMGAAGLAFDADGRVAWDTIWQRFCHLAIAGGPPHKGALLHPGDAPKDDAARYDDVVAELCRAIDMVTGLPVRGSDMPGWIEVTCPDDVMAAWLWRAIVVENVAVHAEGRHIYLPAAAWFRLEKETKNVVTVLAKTCHYWAGHMPRIQHAAIGRMLNSIADMPLLFAEWPVPHDDTASDRVRRALDRHVFASTKCPASSHRYPGWAGVECASVLDAVWITRALVASNVLARREGGVVFVPVNPALDVNGERASRAFAEIHRLRLRCQA